MKKELNIGDEVLVFKNMEELSSANTKYIEGVIIDKKVSDNLAIHGNPKYEMIYTVIDKHGNKHIGAYLTHTFNKTCIKTREDHINYLRDKIYEYKKIIKDIKKDIKEYENIINTLDNKELTLKKH